MREIINCRKYKSICSDELDVIERWENLEGLIESTNEAHKNVIRRITSLLLNKSIHYYHR